MSRVEDALEKIFSRKRDRKAVLVRIEKAGIPPKKVVDLVNKKLPELSKKAHKEFMQSLTMEDKNSIPKCSKAMKAFADELGKLTVGALLKESLGLSIEKEKKDIESLTEEVMSIIVENASEVL